MKHLIGLICIILINLPIIIFDFDENKSLQNWSTVDDGVMGGKSSSSLTTNEQGHGVFEGDLSLENNGGFCSVRYEMKRTKIKDYTTLALTLKGDGKDYQIRIKADAEDYFSYVLPFSTSGKMEEIEIPLKDMYPSWRGRRLNQPNFSSDYLNELTFLIANKKAEHFKLLIDKVEIK